ncbi:MAG: energy transducer TonB [Steroidobacteraceae bacterium]
MLRRVATELVALDAGPAGLVPADELRHWHRTLESARAQHRRGHYAEVRRLLGRNAMRIADALARKRRTESAGNPLGRLKMRHEQWQRFRVVNRIDSPFAGEIDRRYDAIANGRTDEPSPSGTVDLARLLELDRAYDQAFDAGRREALTVERDDRMTQARTLPCPPAVPSAPTAVRRRPRIAPEYSDSNERYYPQRAKREGREGTVVIRAQIDAAGCARQATVQVSSGDTDIDRAAIGWTREAGRFQAAGTTAAPRADWLHFRMRFELK